jgi:hypothetical protein
LAGDREAVGQLLLRRLSVFESQLADAGGQDWLGHRRRLLSGLDNSAATDETSIQNH